MSVLIKGMKKPQNCMMCQFHGFGGYKNELIVCSLTGRSEGQLSNVPDCPLVEIPPHGRLTDADALMLEFAEFVRASNNSDFADVPTWNDAVSLLESAPTTIDAEEGKLATKLQLKGEPDD